MSPKKLAVCIILINILCILPQVYADKSETTEKSSSGATTFEIFKDKQLKRAVLEATVEDTVFINYQSLKVKNAATIKLFVCDTLVKSFSITDTTVFFIPLAIIVDYIDKPDLPYKTVTFAFGKEKPEIRSGNFKLVYQPYSFASIKKNNMGSARPGDQVWIRSELNSDQTDQLVYINEFQVPIGKLFKDKKIPDNNIYYFILKNNISNHDSLESLFRRRCGGSTNVKVEIGSSFDTRKEISSSLLIIFDKNKEIRELISILVSVFILILMVYIIIENKLGLLKDSSTTNKNPTFSLARSQMGFWTIIILIAYFYIWYQTGALIHITPQVLILLGISAGTTVSAHIIDNKDMANPLIAPQLNDQKSTGNFLMDIMSEDQKNYSIHRFQNVAFTIAIGGYFLYEVFIHRVIPDLDTNLMVLMGISSATYIAVKQGENKSMEQKTIG